MFGTFDADFFESLHSDAQADLRNLRTSLPAALRSGDLTALAKQAHFGMSTAGALAASRLFDRLKRLEQAAINGDQIRSEALLAETLQDIESVLDLDVDDLASVTGHPRR